MEGGYLVPASLHRTTEVIERSRFITTVAHAASAADARGVIDAVRAEFPDANHNCWAFVAGPPGSTASVGMSDAGEPHGTAGRPMLDVLLHSQVGDVVAVVTRYFGGVKLGKGGLVRAYGGCVQNALATLPTLLRVDRANVSITAGYGDIEIVKRSLAEHDAIVTSEDYGADVRFAAAVPLSRIDSLAKLLADASAGRIRTEKE